jgi:hypothetical protein
MDAVAHDATMLPNDLLAAAAVSRAALEPALDLDWRVPAGDLEWSCRHTLDHIFEALIFYAGMLATRSPELRETGGINTAGIPLADALTMVETNAAILSEVARAAPPEARAFHWNGMTDASGFVAMGCEEILMHSADIAQGLGLTLRPPADLAGRLRARLFPWAPTEVDPWDALRWAAGRMALPAHPRLGTDWGLHCAPLAEWDGTIAKAKWPVWPVD